jgi:hypothetical protein
MTTRPSPTPSVLSPSNYDVSQVLLPMCHKCATRPLGRDGSGKHEADRKPLTCTNTGGPRRARTDDLRIKSPQLYQLS